MTVGINESLSSRNGTNLKRFTSYVYYTYDVCVSISNIHISRSINFYDDFRKKLGQ